MIDIGFTELLVVSIVALLVIGPEKLPETIRTIALWVGRIRRSLANIKMELEQEIGADEIRQQLHNESIMKDLKETRREVNGIINDTNESLSEIKKTSAIDTSAPFKTIDPTQGMETDTPTQATQDDGKKQSESGR